MAEAIGWILIGIALGQLLVRRMRKYEQDRRDARERRIGWGYGYGAGYTDATAGREYDLTPPSQGYARSQAGRP